MKVRLNKRTIDDAVYRGPGACYLWDTELAAFGVRIYPTGGKSFVVSYWIKGRRRFLTLGRYGKMTLAQAREQALDLFTLVRKGEDPAVGRRGVNDKPTVAMLADRHINDYAKAHNKARSVKRARQLWDRCVLPKLGKRRVEDIGRADIAGVNTGSELDTTTGEDWTLGAEPEPRRPPAGSGFDLLTLIPAQQKRRHLGDGELRESRSCFLQAIFFSVQKKTPMAGVGSIATTSAPPCRASSAVRGRICDARAGDSSRLGY